MNETNPTYDNTNALAQMTAGALNAAGNVFASTFNWKHTNQLLEKQQQFSKDMWKMTTDYNAAYNSPRAQMDRLKEAGINPRLAFANGTINNTMNAVAPSSPHATPVNTFQNPFQGVDMSTISALQETAARIRNLDADSSLKAAETETQGAQKNLLDANLDKNLAEIRNLDSQTYRNRIESANTQAYFELDGGWIDSDGVAHFGDGFAKTARRYGLDNLQADYLDKLQSAEQRKAMIKEANSRTSLLAQQAKSQEYDNEYKSFAIALGVNPQNVSNQDFAAYVGAHIAAKYGNYDDVVFYVSRLALSYGKDVVDIAKAFLPTSVLNRIFKTDVTNSKAGTAQPPAPAVAETKPVAPKPKVEEQPTPEPPRATPEEIDEILRKYGRK